MGEQLVPTPVGQARISWFEPVRAARAVVVLGHGSATGIESADLQAVASALPPRDIAVALVTQPYRLSGSGRGSDEASLDVAWRHVWPHVAPGAMPMIAGGRSAGSQVACRTAKDLGAVGVLALSYPLFGPGSPQELLATGLPTLIVQGGNDPYGRPGQFPPLPPTTELVEVPFGNHTFGVPAGRGIDADATLAIITGAVAGWLEELLTHEDERDMRQQATSRSGPSEQDPGHEG
jgi:predicted alpha/beta-hydrolase family hydrolase